MNCLCLGTHAFSHMRCQSLLRHECPGTPFALELGYCMVRVDGHVLAEDGADDIEECPDIIFHIGCQRHCGP